jgi:ribose 5-phosphate isomerase B
MKFPQTGRREFLAAGASVLSASAATPPLKLAVGGDHAGYPLKVTVVKLLQSWGHSVKDCGSYNPEPVDFPVIAKELCDELTSGRAKLGVMVCGTGVGACIAANKVRGIRAALCHDTYSGHQCVEHDNVNVICLGAQIIGVSIAEEVLRAFLSAKFSTSEEFRRRVRMLEDMDKK